MSPLININMRPLEKTAENVLIVLENIRAWSTVRLEDNMLTTLKTLSKIMKPEKISTISQKNLKFK